MTRRLVVETDGGSRGNPGPAGYGAVVRDAATGEVLAELSDFLGHATNNVAEYSGLIAGLRAGVAAEVPADLLELYDKLRAQHGVGAAMLRGGRCEGCHLSLNAVDLAAYRAASPDEVLRCEECGRILVRTAESGL